MTLSSLSLILFFQADQPATAAGGSAIVEMVRNSGPVAMAVLLVLLVASLYSWTIIFSKWGSFRSATNQSRRFLRAFRKASRLNEVATISDQFRPSPLPLIFDEVYATYKRQTGGSGPPRNMTALERSAQSAASEAITTMEQRLTWLATIGAITPFVGLFGTVMGIVDAFHGLGQSGTATLRAVAPGVSEALITTAAGLLVAIPSVIAYNQFTARLRIFASAVDDFARELLNSMEEIAQRPSALPPGTPGIEREASRGLHQ
jgi:biopolymer transport protein TolQ